MDREVRPPLSAPGRRPPAPHRSPPHRSAGPTRGRGGLLTGGTEGNERLTVLCGLMLIVLLAALGVTILRIGPLLWEHFFIGLLLLGPVALKLASTGYRFARYYTLDAHYRVKGPPAPALRLLAPLVVALTVIVFASGVALLFIGPASSLRNPVFLIHKASFIGWIVVTAIHVLGHLPEVYRLLRTSADTRAEIMALRSAATRSGRMARPVSDALPGGAARWLSLATALAVGVVLAIVLIPDYGIWTSHLTLVHDH